MKALLILCASMIVLMFVASGCYEVVYTVEWKGDSCVKFEDAMFEVEEGVWVDACLGDDEVVQTDIFAVQVDSEVTEILVSLKAGKNKVTDVPVPTDGTEVAVGAFLVSALETAEEPDDPEVFTYLIAVTSDDIPGGKGGTAALSNITFCFVGEGVTIISPEEGELTITRLEEAD